MRTTRKEVPLIQTGLGIGAIVVSMITHQLPSVLAHAVVAICVADGLNKTSKFTDTTAVAAACTLKGDMNHVFEDATHVSALFRAANHALIAATGL
jgi:hypothetical protein